MSIHPTLRKDSASAIAAATPASRERYVDFLRAVNIGVVVFGHWLMAVVFWQGGEFRGENALELVPGLWLATWVLQVMPVFFFVGGFANALTLRRDLGYGAFLRSRMKRLLKPTAVFIGLWIGAAVLLNAFVPMGDDVVRATPHLAKPIWFLACTCSSSRSRR